MSIFILFNLIWPSFFIRKPTQLRAGPIGGACTFLQARALAATAASCAPAPVKQLALSVKFSSCFLLSVLPAAPCVSSRRHYGMYPLWEDTNHGLCCCLCPLSALLQPGKPCRATLSVFIHTAPLFLFNLFVACRFIYGPQKLRVECLSFSFTQLKMESVMERECSALGGLFQTVIGDMKVTLLLFPLTCHYNCW